MKLVVLLLIGLVSISTEGVAQTGSLTPDSINQLNNAMGGIEEGAVLSIQPSLLTPSSTRPSELPAETTSVAEPPSSKTDSLNQASLSESVISNLEKEMQPQLPIGGRQTLKQIGYDQLNASQFDYDPIATPGMPEPYTGSWRRVSGS